VSFHGQTKTAAAGPDSIWKVTLAPMKADGPSTMTIQGKNRITLYNILVGDVWVCSGQSNMEWPVKYSADPDREIWNGSHPKLRLFEVRKAGYPDPKPDLKGQWQECTPQTVGDFSAIGYYFGRSLMDSLNVPIGMIQSAWGGTNIHTWMSRAAIEGNPDIRYLLDGWGPIIDGRPREMVLHYEAIAGWFEYCFVQMSRRESYGDIPPTPKGFDRALWAPGWLFNAMVAPVTRFPVAGAVWCQGEGDSGRGYMYRTLLKTLIRDWRKQWGIKDMPFIVVQLANVHNPSPEPSESAWAELQEAQRMALELPRTGIAVTLDIGQAEDVHYKNKQEAGRRAALAALHAAYSRGFMYSGPMYRSMSVENGKVRLTFDSVGSGLASRDSSPLEGFAIAGEDRKFVWAEARIEGKNEVAVSSDRVAKPVAVRYAWSDNPICNLVNREGLPAPSFRTDDWPGVTRDKK
jgi:sialate O-acetylesterase